jgi:hypothetical protein
MRKMRASFYLFILFCMVTVSVIHGNEPLRPVSKYKPVFMDTSELKKSVFLSAPSEIHIAAKEIFSGNRIIVLEPCLGLHLFDNSNPANPLQTGFLNIPGCGDMQLKENLIYVNNSVDLVVADLSDIKNPVVVNRIRNVFPAPPSPDFIYPSQPFDRIPDNAVIVNWTLINP